VKPWSDFSFCVAGAQQHLLWFLIFSIPLAGSTFHRKVALVIKDKEHKGNPPAGSTTSQVVALGQAKRKALY